MKKALMTLAIAAASISTFGAANAAQAGVSITFSSDEPVVHHAPRVYYPAPRVYYPAPVVVHPGEYYRVKRRHHGRNIDYRYRDARRDGYYDRYDRNGDDEFDRDGYRRRH